MDFILMCEPYDPQKRLQNKEKELKDETTRADNAVARIEELEQQITEKNKELERLKLKSSGGVPSLRRRKP
jgi:ABC-type phosphate transport system auxiliary subunit